MRSKTNAIVTLLLVTLSAPAFAARIFKCSGADGQTIMTFRTHYFRGNTIDINSSDNESSGVDGSNLDTTETFEISNPVTRISGRGYKDSLKDDLKNVSTDDIYIDGQHESSLSKVSDSMIYVEFRFAKAGLLRDYFRDVFIQQAILDGAVRGQIIVNRVSPGFGQRALHKVSTYNCIDTGSI